MKDGLIKSNIEGLYNSVPDADLYNNIYSDLKIVFIEYMKAKFPSVAALSALRHKKLMEKEENRLNKLLEDIQNKIKIIDKNKVDYGFIKTEEFARIVFDVLDKAKSDYREEKLKYYANILINYSTIEFSNDFYKEGIIEKISKYSIEHILVLKRAYEEYKNYSGREDFPQGTFNKNELGINNLDKDLIELCILDLILDGFLYDVTGSSYGIKVPQHFVITKYGSKCIELIANRIVDREAS